ncbi:MAG: hypothetical protein ACM3XZ_03235 [Betaproteobacteria bacterium]
MTDAVIQQIFPGPCPPEGCPPPTEIVCIRVRKVYDFCFEQDAGITQCFPIPAGTSVPVGSTATCVVHDVTCTAGTPVPTGVDGISSVSVLVTAKVDITITRPDGTHFTLANQNFIHTKTVFVCGPVGTSADCEATVACGPCTVIPGAEQRDGQVCCGFVVCLLIETFADVKLLVPAFGFCTPAPCRTGGFPPCPPTPLFPPQCDQAG